MSSKEHNDKCFFYKNMTEKFDNYSFYCLIFKFCFIGIEHMINF